MPLAVEAAAWSARSAGGSVPFGLRRAANGGAFFEIDWAPMVRGWLHQPEDAAAQASALHRGLARMIAEVAAAAGVGTIALTGGCFQNALLHNVDHLEPTLDGEGVRLNRVPREVWEKLNAMGKTRAFAAAGAELRFTASCPPTTAASPPGRRLARSGISRTFCSLNLNPPPPCASPFPEK